MATPGRFAAGAVVPLDELDHTAHAHEVEGVDLGEGDVPFSLILVHGGPGELRLTAIHGAGAFDTEWLEGDDPAWMSPPRE